MTDNGSTAEAAEPNHPMQRLLEHFEPRMLARLRLQLAITRTLRAELPEPLNAHCWCSRIEDTTLTVTVDEASQASLIHYQQRELLKRINADFKERLAQPLRRIRIRVGAIQAGRE